MSVRRTSPFNRPALVIFLIVGLVLFIAAIWQLTVIAQAQDDTKCDCSKISSSNKSALIFWGVAGMLAGVVFTIMAFYYLIYAQDRSGRRLYRLK